ncbi:hypothetical protein Cgig2_018375 [Carnegiea gigantea]|uniref:Uncharacterized protein n=1 Tax=Carnegiea gigantea TaxID=171969 RepID=A0A9Q1JUI4_9CARY|nr:hypothetical protein Cgig2_018375 [Carnegiea gigantea]
MGNCIRRESQMQWGGEDWSQVMPTDDEKLAMKIEEELGISTGDMMMMDDHHKNYYYCGNNKSYSKGSSKAKSTEVKIKITKKQLEKMLDKADLEHQDGLSVQQVLVQLMKVGAQFESHQRYEPDFSLAHGSITNNLNEISIAFIDLKEYHNAFEVTEKRRAIMRFKEYTE